MIFTTACSFHSDSTSHSFRHVSSPRSLAMHIFINREPDRRSFVHRSARARIIFRLFQVTIAELISGRFHFILVAVSYCSHSGESKRCSDLAVKIQ